MLKDKLHKGVIITDVTVLTARQKLNNFLFRKLRILNLQQSINTDHHHPLLTCCRAAEGQTAVKTQHTRFLPDASITVTLLLMNDSAALPPGLSGAPCPPPPAVRPSHSKALPV